MLLHNGEIDTERAFPVPIFNIDSQWFSNCTSPIFPHTGNAENIERAFLLQ